MAQDLHDNLAVASWSENLTCDRTNLRGSRLRAVAAVVVLGGSLIATEPTALSGTYYVDPANGNDSNSGTSPTTAWATLPGTMKPDGTAYLNAAWGSVTTSNKLAAGDIIYLKGGETQASGQVFICNSAGCNNGASSAKPGFYNDGTPDNPIRIEVHPTWGNGDFTFDFSNVTGWSTNHQNQGAIYIRLPYLWLQGASESRRIKIIRVPSVESRQYMARVFTPTNQLAYKGVVLRYIEVDGTDNGVGDVQGVDFSRSDNWIVANSYFHDLRCNGCYSFLCGGYNDNETNYGMVVDSEFAASDGGGTIDNARNVKFLRVKTHDHKGPYDGRGLNVGVIRGSGESYVSIFDTQAWGNDHFAIGHSGCGSNSCACKAQVRVIHVNLLAHGPETAGNTGSKAGIKCYGGVYCGVYNSTFFGATSAAVRLGADHRRGSCADYRTVGSCGPAGIGNCAVDSDCTDAGAATPCYTSRPDGEDPTTFVAKNSIFWPAGRIGVTCYGVNDSTITESPTNPINTISDYNVWAPSSNGADSDTLARHDNADGCKNPIQQCDYTNGGCDWNGPHDLLGVANQPSFINANTAGYSGTISDYSFKSGSVGIDAGEWYCKTTNAGVGATRLDVDCDPMEFFYDSDDYPGGLVADDVAYIGIGTDRACVVESVSHSRGWGSAGTITCKNSLTWSVGEGVSRKPVYGSVPDIGAVEFNGSALSAPVLHSVEAVP